MLLTWIGNTSLLTIPYMSTEDSGSEETGYHMKYSPHLHESPALFPAIFNNEDVLAQFLQHSIPGEGFSADKLQVRDASSRMTQVEKGRLVVLRKDRLQYKVLKTVSAGKQRGDEDISMS